MMPAIEKRKELASVYDWIEKQGNLIYVDTLTHGIVYCLTERQRDELILTYISCCEEPSYETKRKVGLLGIPIEEVIKYRDMFVKEDNIPGTIEKKYIEVSLKHIIEVGSFGERSVTEYLTMLNRISMLPDREDKTYWSVRFKYP